VLQAPTGSRFFRRPAAQAAALFLLTLLAYLPALGRQEFVGTEDFRARIAGEMLDSGDWIAPTFYGRPILTKPPLAYWALAGTFFLTGGRGPAQARLVSVAALAGIVVLLGMAGRAAGGPRAGWLAGLGYLLTLNTVKNGVNAEIDPLFSFFVVAGVLAWWRAHGSACRRPGTWAMAAGLTMGLAAAAKGPAVLPFLAAAVAGGWLAGRPPRGRTTLFAAFPFLAAALAWPLVILARGPAEDALLQGHRIVTAWDAEALRELLLFPFSLLVAALPFSIAALFRLRAAGRAGLDRHLTWTVALSFFLISFAAEKATRYLLPCLPLLVLAGVLRLELLARSTSFVRGFCAFLPLLAAGVLPFVAGAVGLTGLLILAAVALLGVAGYRLAPRFPVAALALLIVPVRGLFTQVYVPQWEAAGHAAAPAVEPLRRLLGPGTTLGVARLETPRLLDPLDRRITWFPKVADLRRALRDGARFDALLIAGSDPELPPGFHLAGTLRVQATDLNVYQPGKD